MNRPTRNLLPTLLIAALVSLLCACAGSQPPRRTADYDGLPSAGRQSARITDPMITADRRFMASLAERMGKLNAGGVAAKNYHLSKAGAWLDFATEEYADNDRGGIVEAALEQALSLVRGLEAREPNLPMDTPVVTGSRRIREDLWQRAAAFKRDRGFECVADRVARLEVQLVWAGHEDLEGGWRHAKPYIEIAEDMAAGIDAAQAECARAGRGAGEAASTAATTASKTGTAAAGSAATTAPSAPLNESVTLSADALFRFDGASSADMLPAGRAQLDALVVRLRALTRIERVLVTGHSDRLGDSAFNLRLSKARAQTVRQYLIEQGIDAALVQAAGAGESEPVVTCSGDRAQRALVDCLQPNRRVELRIIGVQTRSGRP